MDVEEGGAGDCCGGPRDAGVRGMRKAGKVANRAERRATVWRAERRWMASVAKRERVRSG